jgi:hypothetical protein
VLKALAEFYDLSLGELIEDLVVSTFAGRKPFSTTALARAAELMRIYGLDFDTLPAAHGDELSLTGTTLPPPGSAASQTGPAADTAPGLE